MKQTGTMTQTDNPDLDDLFERYKAAPKSHVFAPLADACRKAGMLEEALEICARGVGEHPRYASGYVVQGKCLYDARRPGDAQAAFDRVLLLDPKNLVALKYLGILHAERGDNARAREYFEHILALDPDNRDIRSRIEDVELDAIHTPQASVRADDTMKIDVAAVHQMLASSERDEEEEIAELPDVKDETFAGETITLGDESVTSDEIATMTLADIYASQGYNSRALKIYREVQKRQPDNRTLAMKIDAIEKEVKASIEAAKKPVPEEGASPQAGAPEEDKPVARRYEPAPSSRPAPAPAQGNPIDQTQNYEQFKRWLKATSR